MCVHVDECAHLCVVTRVCAKLQGSSHKSSQLEVSFSGPNSSSCFHSCLQSWPKMLKRTVSGAQYWVIILALPHKAVT